MVKTEIEKIMDVVKNLSDKKLDAKIKKCRRIMKKT